jgi:hypothetical protein
MDTVISAALLVIALLILRSIAQIRREDAQRRVRTYRADVATRAAQRGGDIEADCQHLWRLQCAGQTASRREVTRRQEMTAARWNKASRVIAHLRLAPAQTPYSEGASIIRDYVREQARLARQTSFVPPTD